MRSRSRLSQVIESVWLVSCDDCVVAAVVREARMGVDPGVAKRRILVAAEGEDSLIHLLGVEDPEPHEQVEVLDSEAGDGEEQSGSSILITSWRVFSRKSVRYMNAGMRVANLISFSWNEFALGLVLLLLVCELLLSFAVRSPSFAFS